MLAMTRERRKNTRIAINHPVFYVGMDSSGNVETQGMGLAMDISVEGMMFESEEPIDATMLTIHATIAGGLTIRADGLLV